MRRVCFFGAYDPEYPRNRILRAGLERSGVEVREVRVKERRAWLRYPSLAAAFAPYGNLPAVLDALEARRAARLGFG